MPKTVTEDHGKIIHFAGAHHLFPVAKKGDAKAIRLAGHDGVGEDDVRIGWDKFFRAFIDGGMAFVHDEAEGRPLPRAEAEAAAR